MSNRLSFEDRMKELNENEEETKWILSGAIIKKENQPTFSDGVEKRAWIGQQKHKMKTKQLSEKRSSLLRKVIEKHTLSFKDKIEEVRHMAQRNNRFPTTYQKGEKNQNSQVFSDGTDAGNWITRQRYRLRKGELTEEEQKLLEELLDEFALSFEDKIEQLKVTIKKDKRAPIMFKKNRRNLGYRTFSNGTDQGAWLTRQKTKMQEGKLTKQQEELLKETLELIEKVTWEKGYQEAQRYQNIYGTLQMVSSYMTKDNFPLGKFMQKEIEKSREVEKSIEQIIHEQKLTELDPNWMISYEEQNRNIQNYPNRVKSLVKRK